MALEMAKFSTFGANLRKFNLHGLIEEDLDYQNPLKPLTPMEPLKSTKHSKFVKFSFRL